MDFQVPEFLQDQSPMQRANLEEPREHLQAEAQEEEEEQQVLVQAQEQEEEQQALVQAQEELLDPPSSSPWMHRSNRRGKGIQAQRAAATM